MRRIYYYQEQGCCPVAEFFSRAGEKAQDKLRFQLEYIRDSRNSFAVSYIRHFSEGRYSRLYECRMKVTGAMLRVIFYDYQNEIILLHAFWKHDRKDTPKGQASALKILNRITKPDGSIPSEYKKEYEVRIA